MSIVLAEITSSSNPGTIFYFMTSSTFWTLTIELLIVVVVAVDVVAVIEIVVVAPFVVVPVLILIFEVLK